MNVKGSGERRREEEEEGLGGMEREEGWRK